MTESENPLYYISPLSKNTKILECDHFLLFYIISEWMHVGYILLEDATFDQREL